MPDEIDRANALNDDFQAAALRAARRRLAAGESLTECIDCEEPIPEARRRAVPGCRRCIQCQRSHEMKTEGM